MVGLFVLGSMVCICLVVGSLCSTSKNDSGLTAVGVGFIICGAIFLVFFAFDASQAIRSGLPMVDINSGQYKVGFVYQAGNKVSLGVEINDNNMGLVKFIALKMLIEKAIKKKTSTLHMTSKSGLHVLKKMLFLLL